MASANLDLVGSICAAWRHGDYSAIVGGLTSGSWTGVAAMTERSRDLLNAWEDFRIELDEYHELEGERVLVLWEFRGRGTTSGLEAAQMRGTGAYLFHIRDRKVSRLAYCVDASARSPTSPSLRTPDPGARNPQLPQQA